MKLAVITQDTVFEREHEAINGLFKAGMPLLHMRKPNSSESDVRELIGSIDSVYHDRIVLHDHFGLLDTFKLKGVHLNGRNPQKPSGNISSISRSCHSIEEVTTSLPMFDYVFLSPIFDSISKAGYGCAFSDKELRNAHRDGIINDKVYALGGISTETLPMAKEYGFGGAAVLGALWSDYHKSNDCQALENRFKELMTLTETK